MSLLKHVASFKFMACYVNIFYDILCTLIVCRIMDIAITSSACLIECCGTCQSFIFRFCCFMSFFIMCVVRKNGISFVSIDESLPLSEQGPFDVILHKITSKEWQQVLEVRSCHIDLNVFCLIFLRKAVHCHILGKATCSILFCNDDK